MTSKKEKLETFMAAVDYPVEYNTRILALETDYGPLSELAELVVARIPKTTQFSLDRHAFATPIRFDHFFQSSIFKPIGIFVQPKFLPLTGFAQEHTLLLDDSDFNWASEFVGNVAIPADPAPRGAGLFEVDNPGWPEDPTEAMNLAIYVVPELAQTAQLVLSCQHQQLVPDVTECLLDDFLLCYKAGMGASPRTAIRQAASTVDQYYRTALEVTKDPGHILRLIQQQSRMYAMMADLALTET